jgi:Ran-binding protein 1
MLAQFKAKLYRYREEEWKERGTGKLKFLQHNSTHMIRMVVRAEKTGRVCLNHKVIKKDIFCELKKNLTENKAWMWMANNDYSDGAASVQNFCARFSNDEDYGRFAVEFNKACEENEKILEEVAK